MKLRQRVLDDEPLCRACLAAGLTTPAEEVDHILPLHLGGTDARDNFQGLCVPCHGEKTRAENAHRACRQR
ncbi:HNH endonuclease [Vibrio coralliilyticus]|uniref:HNH endonuclease n=1 Tax=Vibrio coralliilyticus TaxID=190893 RepID=UPI001F5BC335|nr:HNH endonuclease signature motif containing protein [Vibrio coralliilyticus]